MDAVGVIKNMYCAKIELVRLSKRVSTGLLACINGC